MTTRVSIRFVIAKLKLGFIIAGTNLSAHMGLQVQLVRHASTARTDVFYNRVVAFVRPQDA